MLCPKGISIQSGSRQMLGRSIRKASNSETGLSGELERHPTVSAQAPPSLNTNVDPENFLGMPQLASSLIRLKHIEMGS